MQLRSHCCPAEGTRGPRNAAGTRRGGHGGDTGSPRHQRHPAQIQRPQTGRLGVRRIQLAPGGCCFIKTSVRTADSGRPPAGSMSRAARTAPAEHPPPCGALCGTELHPAQLRGKKRLSAPLSDGLVLSSTTGLWEGAADATVHLQPRCCRLQQWSQHSPEAFSHLFPFSGPKLCPVPMSPGQVCSSPHTPRNQQQSSLMSTTHKTPSQHCPPLTRVHDAQSKHISAAKH